jgi:arginyl-tRNA synthetase
MKDYIENILNNSLSKLGAEKKEITLDKPRDEKFGDLTTNVAMTLAKELKSSPRKIAEDIIANLDYDKDLITKVEIAGAGFINFYISDNIYKKVLKDILTAGESFGKADTNKGLTANLEWVSANPTGPLHLGHGRQVCLGKAIASLMEWTGYTLTREYYYNDAGKQMDNLALSVQARYMQIFQPDFPFPEEGYVGDYIKDVAQILYDEYGDSLKDKTDLDIFKTAGENYNFKKIRRTLNSLGIHHDVFFNETSLYKDGDIEKILKQFKEKGLSYEKEGAVWLKMDEKEGFDKDKVIVKSTGEPTYRLPDMSYHMNKIERGFNLIIDIFGSDHGDTYKEVLYGIKSLGYDISKIKVIIHQMVTFRKGDESIKMSKRSGNVYSLDELIEDIGADATQFFFIMRSANTHLDFDIDLAKEQSDKNPVFYLQYAHARICGILRNADENFPEYKNIRPDEINLNLVETNEEVKLLKTLSGFPGIVLNAAATYEPHKIIMYLNEVAADFHSFYHNNRVIDLENKELTKTRLQICLAVKQVLQNGFNIIGISAPERM